MSCPGTIPCRAIGTVVLISKLDKLTHWEKKVSIGGSRTVSLRESSSFTANCDYQWNTEQKYTKKNNLHRRVF